MNQVFLVEVSPRDGWQSESRIVPTEKKLDYIQGMVKAGLREIQAISLVNPAKVPQMADAEELVPRLPFKEEVTYSGLVLNEKGLERSVQVGLKCVEVSLSVSDTHSRKNAGMDFQSAFKQVEKILQKGVKEGLMMRGSLQCSFGCIYEGEVSRQRLVDVCMLFMAYGAKFISLADTTGMAYPDKVKKILELVQKRIPARMLGLHLHDTRGTGLVNLMTGLKMGIRRFDASIGGMGGCPFIPGAAGNIATEDALYLLHCQGYDTGVDLEDICRLSRKMQDFFGKSFPAKNSLQTLNKGQA